MKGASYRLKNLGIDILPSVRADESWTADKGHPLGADDVIAMSLIRGDSLRMSPDAPSDEIRSPHGHPAADLKPAARIAAAATLVLGSGCQAVAFLLIPDLDDSTAWLTWIAENETRGQLSKLFDVLAMPFLVLSAAVYILLGRIQSPMLAWIGGVSLASGMVGFAMLQGWEVLAYNMVSDGVASPEVVGTAVDDIASSPAGTTALVLFMVLGFGGLLLTLVSLWQSKVVPRPAVLVLLAGFVVDAFFAPVEGHVVMFVAASWIAVTVLRARSPHSVAEPSRHPES